MFSSGLNQVYSSREGSRLLCMKINVLPAPPVRTKQALPLYDPGMMNSVALRDESSAAQGLAVEAAVRPGYLFLSDGG